jgi:hypothetical protein
MVMLVAGLFAAAALAQVTGQPLPEGAREPAKGHGPPPQAYEDCKGRKAGDAVQHTTPEGKVAATCVESPKGLVARPNQPRPAPQGGPAR